MTTISCILPQLLIVAGLAAQQTSSGTTSSVSKLLPPNKTVSYSITKQQGTSGMEFSHGYLVKFVHFSSGEPNIFICDSAGQPQKKLLIMPPNTASVFLTSVDIGLNSRLAFAGKSTSADGSSSPFIGFSGLDGANPVFYDTKEYEATKIAAADDGSVWTVGAARPDISTVSGKTVMKWTNYDMLRHYSSTGVLMDHYLPRWGTLTAYAAIATDSTGSKASGLYDSTGSVQSTTDEQVSGYVGAWNPRREVFLKSSGLHTILLDGVNHLIYIWDAKTHSLASFPIVGQTLPIITGVVLLETGEVLASLRSSESISGSMRGLFNLAQQSSGSSYEWQEIRGTLNKGHALRKFNSLLGRDDDSFVYSRTQDKSDKSTSYYESKWQH
jgi:hypothetical protein